MKEWVKGVASEVYDFTERLQPGLPTPTPVYFINFHFSGYVTAIDHYEGGLLLQCDISHRVLRTETVRDALTALKKRGGDLKTEAEKALLGVSILTR